MKTLLYDHQMSIMSSGQNRTIVHDQKQMHSSQVSLLKLPLRIHWKFDTINILHRHMCF
ncbi:uncharacterized protein PHALS_10084 [Plasmopara halstedii]|uniref:Uncharacterized protein n=1 Tax=Plasmopara halstedii TaxID=4781 RepID=A0A0P1AFI0_PLAHL|nr:uncharacterized protein PHALS_10084 [Plasmopara halstedii]CEG39853.1 hypothetical protein PHALS_10084 [Plasmopara halstedii]|eukprot:XP_024576222.1 hypothetical protein PHALS_10084 [Plasmopara halstedii]